MKDGSGVGFYTTSCERNLDIQNRRLLHECKCTETSEGYCLVVPGETVYISTFESLKFTCLRELCDAHDRIF